MEEPHIRLRSRRRHASRRISLRRTAALAGGSLVIAGALFAGQQPAAFAPSPPVPVAGQATPAAAIVAAEAPLLQPLVPRVEAGALPTQTVVPTPQPARSPSGEALVASLRSHYTTQWLKNHRETPFRSGPSESEKSWNTLPQFSLLRVMERRGDWVLVYYEGDGKTRQAGPGWILAADTGPVEVPVPWLSTARAATLWSSADAQGKKVVDLPLGANMEVLGSSAIQGLRIKVRLPGDGRRVSPAEGWIEAADVSRVAGPVHVPWAYPAVLNADVRLPVLYRTQLDGSSYASANCGPTTVGMVLEGFGIDVSLRKLREQTLAAQDGMWDDQAGSFIWALARVAQSYGVKVHDLYESDGTTLNRWSVEDVRNAVKQGRPVIMQVRYRNLPGRADSDYYGDHYVVVTGLLGDRFLYNDPIWGTTRGEGPGFDRVMTAAELERAMNASDRPYAYSAFALSRS